MQANPVLRRRSFLHGERLPGTGEKDVAWLAPDGGEMAEAEWTDDDIRCVGAVFAGGDLGEVDHEGRPVVGTPLVYLLNAGAKDIEFLLPETASEQGWQCVLDSADQRRHERLYASGTLYPLSSRSVAVFSAARPPGDQF
jgi:glycogen operon protein